MKRRDFIGYLGAGLVTVGVTTLASVSETQAQSESLSIQWLGHTCFLFTARGLRILVNPFQTIGCTSGYRPAKVMADVVLISSKLLDEGAVDGLPGKYQLVYEPGVYEFGGINLQGISIDHDRLGGKRFGKNIAWKWQQGGINILHLGGAAAPISTEHRILMGRPDVVLIPVGGSDKAYNAQEAQQAIKVLNPKLVIPTHYRTAAADPVGCDITPVDEFLRLMQSENIRKSKSDTITIVPDDLPTKTVIQLLSYQF